MNGKIRIKPGFILKNIAGDYIVVPSGKNIVDFKIMLTLNETGAWLWEKLTNGDEISSLIDKFREFYDIDYDVAKSDVGSFIQQLSEQGIIEKTDQIN